MSRIVNIKNIKYAELLSCGREIQLSFDCINPPRWFKNDVSIMDGCIDQNLFVCPIRLLTSRTHDHKFAYVSMILDD